MKKLFWDYLIEVEEIKVKLDKHGMVKEESYHLLKVAHDTFNLKILDEVLSYLPKEKHKEFLKELDEKPDNPKLLEVLKKEVEDIENKIKEVVKNVKQEILEKIEEITD
ncbi:hypothetical protein COT75_03815 [Candidatus Beckwithbacteria bacterium CG10_big_fil_rev_8_21_14_0_10_34_10]|uniref:Uncharacterized protein n=1 Tax=Candidatus Beckwithbacteria bacterium CG10_big_fil_rev_8_21_14_0_10_34_10 TaxID=1974495 RepID=A0A2H0W8H7_9BACT|nr:MAG: hypothetical protein COT75_03815 [Candidatus Beckwithbacteria bacterium CG10_big_fil_rev_8_21_14_0_10_34_10]